MGEAGYQPGVPTSAGLDAEQVRWILSAAFAVAGYLIPAGTMGVIKNWANILGKESADKIAALETRVFNLEQQAKR